METQNQKTESTREKLVHVQSGLIQTLTSILELREDWIKNQRYESASELRELRQRLEIIKQDFELLARKTP